MAQRNPKDRSAKGTVIFSGRPIRTVYLAGKITGTTWRDEIVEGGWSYANHSAIDFDLGEDAWQTVERCLPLPDGRRLDLTGPYWRDLYGGHGCVSDNDSPHASGIVGRYGQIDCSHLVECATQIVRSLRRSDLVFAWIDRPDCYGTLWELGFAYGLGKRVVIAVPDQFRDTREFWLPLLMSDLDRMIVGGSARKTWDTFWCRTLDLPEPARTSEDRSADRAAGAEIEILKADMAELARNNQLLRKQIEEYEKAARRRGSWG